MNECPLITFHISQWIQKTIHVSRRRSGSPATFNQLFTGPLPTFPENFYATSFGSFCAKLLTDDSDDCISSLAEVITEKNRVETTVSHRIKPVFTRLSLFESHKRRIGYVTTRMWANAQRHGRPAEHRWRPLFNAAKFGWRPLLECRAVTLPRRETRSNYLGSPKLTKRSQPLVGRSSPYCGDK